MWNNLYATLPFQAIEFIIGNVTIDHKVNQENATNILSSMILNEQIQAVIIQNYGDIVVEMVDVQNNDIGGYLVEHGLAKEKKICFSKPSMSNMIPI